MKKIITVEKNGLFYNCICISLPSKYKCGKCLRGNIYGDIGERCRVCNSIVCDIKIDGIKKIGNHKSPFGIGE